MGGDVAPPVWDALNRATATISRRPESDGPQANGDGFSAVDYTEAKWATRKDGKPTVVHSSLSLTSWTGG
jgi:hypothetical protein